MLRLYAPCQGSGPPAVDTTWRPAVGMHVMISLFENIIYNPNSSEEGVLRQCIRSGRAAPADDVLAMQPWLGMVGEIHLQLNRTAVRCQGRYKRYKRPPG